MKKGSKREKPARLVKQFKRRLLLSVGLLLLILIVQVLLSFLISVARSNFGEQEVTIRADLDGILSSMIDQETGLRGYITTNDPAFLTPFTAGRPQYLSYAQSLKNQTQSNSFSDSRLALSQTEMRAEDWYTGYALVQIKNMQSGHLTTARSESTNASGKTLFDRFRTAEAQLEQSVGSNLTGIQNQLNTFNWTELGVVGLLLMIAVVILWRALSRFSSVLVEQLQTLKDTSSSLGAGDWSVRVPDLTYVELNQFGQTFNHMADALQLQQEQGLYEKDVLACILQLKTDLTYSAENLDLKAIIDKFLDKALTLLDLHLGALYLCDTAQKQMTLFAAQGVDLDQVQLQFQRGEGTIGRVLLNHEPLYLTRPTDEEAKGFVVKSMLGIIRPSSSYYLPLMSGNELIGVLGVASVFPMPGKVRDILDVIASNLSSVISNIKAYQHIQEQAEELEKHGQEQKQTNAELRQQRDELTILNSALEEANRARSQFLSTMSHELRTPLASIIGFSQILLDDAGKINFTPRQKSNLERILKNGKHLLLLINDVLDLAKVEAGRMDVSYSQVDVREIVSSVVDETQSIAIGQKLSLSYTVEDNLSLATDPLKLRQILLNLISNALKFTPQGEVTVTATRVTAADSGAECIAIAVKDTGIGIAPADQERIFEAFVQVDSGNSRKFGGTGLGLSIVREMTTVLGGTLEMASSPGQGSTFTITLPIKISEYQVKQEHSFLTQLSKQAIPRLLPPSGELTSPVLDKLFEVSLNRGDVSTQRNVILAVDDNPDILILIKSALENTPFEVVGVQDPLKVVEMVHTLRPCVITLDVMMPDLNGWQILHQLKTDPATASIPVVVLTILSERSTGYILGADEYLIKPFKNGVLLETIHRLVSSNPPAQSQELEQHQA
jgi:two-component system, chemotaxis family, sensor kinase CheA